MFLVIAGYKKTAYSALETEEGIYHSMLIGLGYKASFLFCIVYFSTIIDDGTMGSPPHPPISNI